MFSFTEDAGMLTIYSRPALTHCIYCVPYSCTAGEPETEEAICEAGGVPALVSLIRRSAEAPDQADLLQPATIALCNLAAGDEARRNAIVEAGALPTLVKLLSHQVRIQQLCGCDKSLNSGHIQAPG